MDLFSRILKLDPKTSKARINLGNVYLGKKELAEAENIYRSAISLMRKTSVPD